MGQVTIGDYTYVRWSGDEAWVKLSAPRDQFTYGEIQSTVTIDGQLCYVTHLCERIDDVGLFEGCTYMMTPPSIPNTVYDFNRTFINCTSLVTAPTFSGIQLPSSADLPYFNNYVSMNSTFKGCTKLKDVASLPSIDDPTVKFLFNSTFEGCVSLVNSPALPLHTYNMIDMYNGCVLLQGAPDIPTSVTRLDHAFENCSKITYINIELPNIVNTTDAFKGCTNLTGYINMVSSSLTNYAGMFTGTTKPIYINSLNTTVVNYLTGQFSNVRVGTIEYTMLDSRRLTSEENQQYETIDGIRVDMLLDCSYAGRLTGISVPASNSKLYNVADDTNPIDFVNDDTDFDLLRCYLVFNGNTQTPTSNLSIKIANEAPSNYFSSGVIGYPTTATLAQIKQEGETDPISPTIDVTNVRFNPETTGLNKYTVGDVIGVTLTDMTKTQTNVDGDVKHIVTHADNVKVNDTTTLQDWITEQYNYLTP